jgi:hypothetical protein
MIMRFLYKFTFSDMLPIIEMQRLAAQQTAIETFAQQAILQENLMRMLQDRKQESVMAEAASESKEEMKEDKEQTSRTYNITYYNPETHKTEVLKAKTDIKVKDIAQTMIEESIGAGTTYPLYSFIGQPIIKQEIVPWKLKQILEEREYGTPPSAGGGAAVTPASITEEREKEIVAVKKHEDEIREAISEAILRKEKSELMVVDEIILLEETVEALREGEDINRVLAKLPPLSRARYIVALKKKKLSRKKIIEMLLRDASFLKKLKKKLGTFTLEDLLNMVKILRKMRK